MARITKLCGASHRLDDRPNVLAEIGLNEVRYAEIKRT